MLLVTLFTVFVLHWRYSFISDTINEAIEHSYRHEPAGPPSAMIDLTDNDVDELQAAVAAQLNQE